MTAFAACITRALATVTPCSVDTFGDDSHTVAFVDVAPAMVDAALAALAAHFQGATRDGDTVTTRLGSRIYVLGA